LAEAEYAEEFFEAAIPDASPLPWPSPMLSGSALPCPFRGDYQRCRIPFMVRTTVLHLLLGGIFRFSTSSHPEALEACYVALWRLPRPDSHRLADSDFQGTPASARCGSNTASAATAPATVSPAESRDARPWRTCAVEPATTGQALHGPDGAQRMIPPHALLGRQVTEHVILLLIGSSHGFSYHMRLWIGSSFSAAR
jgi:hypothetical protein